VAGPDGVTSSSNVVKFTNGGAGEQSFKGSATYVAGQHYYCSVFVKPGTCTSFQAVITTAVAYDGTGGNAIVFNLSTKTIDLSYGVLTGKGKITALPNGWFLCTWDFVATYSATTNGGFWINLGQTASDPTQYLWLYGAHMTDVPSSFIPNTTGSPVTRAADTVSANGLLYTNVPENDYPAWDSTKLYLDGDRVLDLASHKVYESISGTAGTATITIANPAVVSMTDSTGAVYVPSAGTPVRFTTTGALPTGLVANTTYYVVSPTATSFSVSASVGGAAINTSGSQSGTHTATASVNLNKVVTNTAYWLDAGYDNRWDMFDQSITSQTAQAGDIVVVFSASQRIDSIVGLNCAANTAKVAMTDKTTGKVVYSATANLISSSNIQDLYRYLYEPIVQMPEFIVDEIPLGISNNSVITVTFSSGGTTKVGGLVFGLSKDIGVTEWGAKVGTVDYSLKTKDDFGNYVITPRAFSKKGDFTVQVPTASVDFLQNMLAQFRATPVVYIGSNSGNRTQFNSTIIYGFYKDFSIDISYNAFSVCSLSVEGLT
jgi:hypothetical protein